jgi:hypothetical protein
MIASTIGMSIAMIASVGIVRIVGVTCTTGCNVWRLERVGTRGVTMGRRRVSQGNTRRSLVHGTQRLRSDKVAKRPWCTGKTAGGGRLG